MDNHATTRVDPRVVAAMLPFFTETYGNPASRTHGFGWKAEEAVEGARGQVASLIGAGAREIVFTSGATESNNLAIRGAVLGRERAGAHVITVQTEHKSVLDPCKRLEREGVAEVTYLKPRRDGRIEVDVLRAALREQTVLVSVMLANNEIGVLQPLAEIGAVTRQAQVLLHCDAAQAAGKVAIDVGRMGIDLLSLSGHKLYGPKGIGALYVRGRGPRIRLRALIDGGGHERGMRSGTLNVPGIAGLGHACAIAAAELEAESARLLALRERLRTRLLAALPDTVINGDLAERLPGNLHVSFPGIEAESLLIGLDDVAVSSGSACTSATLEPSHVLRSLGVRDELAHGSVRFGLGRFNEVEEVDYAAERVIEEVLRLRKLSGRHRAQPGAAGVDREAVP
jgi:cysteine desulfurase